VDAVQLLYLLGTSIWANHDLVHEVQTTDSSLALVPHEGATEQGTDRRHLI
jgi:hypothetical protein